MKTIASFIALSVVVCPPLLAEQQKATARKLRVLREILSDTPLQRAPEAEEELLEHLRSCGEGVFSGRTQSNAANRCSYQLEVDNRFLLRHKQLTGYQPDPDLSRSAEVQWVTVADDELKHIPDRWDLSDHGTMYPIQTQKCG